MSQQSRAPRSRAPRSRRLLAQVGDLSVAAPQVIAHRVARMVGAGMRPTPSDQREMLEMVLEKPYAFAQAGWAMAWYAWQLQVQTAATMLQWAALPLNQRPLPGMGRTVRSAGEHALDLLSAGIEPVRRKAVRNARRLGRKGR